nr:hypothetical protein BaRGS_030545 [Batillaria attramentaria]
MIPENLSFPSDGPENMTGTLRYAPLEFVDTLPALAIILIAVLVVAAVMGTAGNLLILVSVATHKDLRNVESVFVVNLACSDLYVTLIADPLSIVAWSADWSLLATLLYAAPGAWGTAGGHALPFARRLCTISCVGSLMTLSAMSCNRYVLIVHPNYYRRIFTLPHSVIMCLCFYLVGFLLVSLNFFGVGDHSFDHKSLECIWDRMANHDYTIVFAFVLVLVPITVTGLAYTRLYLHVRRVRMKVHSHGNNSTNVASTSHVTDREDSAMQMSVRLAKDGAKKSELKAMMKEVDVEKGSGCAQNVSTASQAGKSATTPQCSQDRAITSGSTKNATFRLARTLFFIYLVFSVCWLPFALLMILDSEDTFSHELHVVIVAWAHLHPSLSWLVYYHTHSKFRRAFRKLLRLDMCCGSSCSKTQLA